MGLLFAVVGLVLGVFMLILDFDFVERGIAAGLPERESWRAAFAPDREPGLDLHQPAAHPRDHARRLTPAALTTEPAQPDAAAGRPSGRARLAWSSAVSRRLAVGLRAGGGGAAARPSGRGRRARRRRPRCRRSRCPGSWRPGPRRRAIGSTPSPRNACGLASSSADQAERREHRRQQHRRPARVAVGRRVEPVRAEEQRGCRGELGPEDRAERHGAAAGLDDGDRLRGGQPARPDPGDLAQRRRRSAGWCRGPGRCRPRTSTPASRRRRTASERWRTDVRRQHRVGDVVGADQDDGDVAARSAGAASTWPARSLDWAPDHGERAQVDPAVAPARPRRRRAARPGSPRPGRRRSPAALESPSSATLTAGPGRPRPYQPVASGRRSSSACRSPAGRAWPRPSARRRGGAEHGQAAAAVGGGGRQLACCTGFPHSPNLTDARIRGYGAQGLA